MMRNPSEAQSGFTLFELMLVVALAAVILAVATPNFRSFTMNNQMTSAANDLLAAIHSARSEAVNRRLQAVLCFSSNPAAAVPVCTGDGTQGWVVFIDDRNAALSEATDNNGIPDANEPIVLRHEALPASIRSRTTPAGNEGYIAFNAAGFSRQTALGERFDGVVMCDQRGNKPTSGADLSAARGIVVSVTGRPRVTRSVTEISSDARLGACP